MASLKCWASFSLQPFVTSACPIFFPRSRSKNWETSGTEPETRLDLSETPHMWLLLRMASQILKLSLLPCIDIVAPAFYPLMPHPHIVVPLSWPGCCSLKAHQCRFSPRAHSLFYDKQKPHLLCFGTDIQPPPPKNLLSHDRWLHSLILDRALDRPSGHAYLGQIPKHTHTHTDTIGAADLV